MLPFVWKYARLGRGLDVRRGDYTRKRGQLGSRVLPFGGSFQGPLEAEA